MKALTITEPWTELILRGRNPFELRSWRMKYRGRLVIHATLKVNAWGVLGLQARHVNEDMMFRPCLWWPSYLLF